MLTTKEGLIIGMLAGTGCYADGYGFDLEYVAPGVSVVATSDYYDPVFYSDSYYWRYNNGYWYQSSDYYGGWRYATPPIYLRNLANPGYYGAYGRYGRYGGHHHYGGTYPHRYSSGVYGGARHNYHRHTSPVRDHRSYSSGGYRGHQNYRGHQHSGSYRGHQHSGGYRGSYQRPAGAPSRR